MTGEILDIYDDLCYIYLSLRRRRTTSHGLIHDPQPNSWNYCVPTLPYITLRGTKNSPSIAANACLSPSPNRVCTRSVHLIFSFPPTVLPQPPLPPPLLTFPEHFSTPLYFARAQFSLPCTLVPFPSGTGHMITSLQSNDIDMAIGLTEGWVAGLGKAQAEGKDAGYNMVGTYVETPLCWAISTGANREDVTAVEGLRGKKMGVSRIGR